MAREGIAFLDFHSAFSACTAARGALLTGRLAPRTGVGMNFGPDSDAGMALGEQTIADLLAPAGYESHMIGKWLAPFFIWKRSGPIASAGFRCPRQAPSLHFA